MPGKSHHPESIGIKSKPDPRPELLDTEVVIRRIIADVLDLLLILGVSLLVGLPLGDLFYALGPWGRLFPYIVAVAYFTVMGSSIGRGQTLGKRLMRLQILDADGHPLPPSRALLRSLLLFLPLLVFNWRVPLLNIAFFGHIVMAVISVGGLLALIYGYLGNSDTAQGPHDFAVSSYVVAVPETNTVEAPPGNTIHPGVMALLLVAAGFAIFVPGLFGASQFAGLADNLARDGDFYYLSINHDNVSGILTVDAWYGGDCSGIGCDDLIRQMTRTIVGEVAEYEEIQRLDALRITLYQRKDLTFGLIPDLPNLLYQERRSINLPVNAS